MKVAILAGGLGTRLQEKTKTIPKPMVEIGGLPILWHIMKIYSSYGFNEFVIALGYKGYLIKEFFMNYRYHASNLTIDLKSGEIAIDSNNAENWKVTLLDTGSATMTGGRVKRICEHIKGEPFLLTYGDGVANIDIKELVQFHQQHKKTATVTAVRPTARFGEINFDGDKVVRFQEKPQTGAGWINGGFFVLEPEIVNYLEGDDTIFEQDPLENLARAGELMAYRHNGFWQCMDTLRDVTLLNELWEQDPSKWKAWND